MTPCYQIVRWPLRSVALYLNNDFERLAKVIQITISDVTDDGVENLLVIIQIQRMPSGDWQLTERLMLAMRKQPHCAAWSGHRAAKQAGYTTCRCIQIR